MDFGIGSIIQIIGSLAFFIFGMKMMSEGIQRAAGSQLRGFLGNMTKEQSTGCIYRILNNRVGPVVFGNNRDDRKLCKRRLAVFARISRSNDGSQYWNHDHRLVSFIFGLQSKVISIFDSIVCHWRSNVVYEQRKGQILG